MLHEQKLIPKRRFKEFHNTEAWEQCKFRNVFNHLQNNSLSRAMLDYEDGEVFNVHYGDILVEYGECLDVSLETLPRIMNNDFGDKYRASYLDNGDVIIADAAEDETVGKCCEIKGLSNELILAGLHTIPCRPLMMFATGYLGYFMNSNAYHDQLLPLMQGTKVSSISKSAIADTYIKYPKDLKEQEKIGRYFIELNNLITLHQRKLSKIKDMKKSYLSEMFPSDGEKVPKRRFAGFTEDWEQRKLLDMLCQPISDGPHETPELVEKGVPFISVDAIVDNQIDFSRIRGFITEKYHNICCLKYRPQLHDVYLVKSGSTVGKTAIVETSEAFNIWSPLAAMRCNNESDSYFLYHLLQTEELQTQVFDKCSHGTQPNLSMRQLEKFDVCIPKLGEQKKISSLFNNLDNLITLHQHKLDKLYDLKKAYLSEMFI